MDKIFADKIVSASRKMQKGAFSDDDFNYHEMVEAIEDFGKIIELLRDEDVKYILRCALKSPSRFGVADTTTIRALSCCLGFSK